MRYLYLHRSLIVEVSITSLHLYFIVNYLIISSFSFGLFEHYFLPLFLTRFFIFGPQKLL